jgi:hypothetical protein
LIEITGLAYPAPKGLKKLLPKYAQGALMAWQIMKSNGAPDELAAYIKGGKGTYVGQRTTLTDTGGLDGQVWGLYINDTFEVKGITITEEGLAAGVDPATGIHNPDYVVVDIESRDHKGFKASVGASRFL